MCGFTIITACFSYHGTPPLPGGCVSLATTLDTTGSTGWLTVSRGKRKHKIERMGVS